MPIPGIIASGVIEQITGAYESIASAVGAGNSASITFSSIPQTYQHLQIRGIIRTNANNIGNEIAVGFNGNTSSLYRPHRLFGNGSTVTASSVADAQSQLNNVIRYAGSESIANNFAVFIMDIHDYASTTKTTTMRCFAGFDNNDTNGIVMLSSGLWNNTSAITSIFLTTTDSSDITAASQFALYGIKGA